MWNKNQRILVNLLAGVFLIFCGLASGQSLQSIINEIQSLEGAKEPKCYATASRLEDFMFGTPLTDTARYQKNDLAKLWVEMLWREASLLARSAGDSRVSEQQVVESLKHLMDYQQSTDTHWQVNFGDKMALVLHGNDKRQYSTIAYSLRTLLAVQQNAMLDLSSDLLSLEPKAIEKITEALDIFSLSVLKLSDQQARMSDQFEIDEVLISQIWNQMLSERQRNRTSAIEKALDKKPHIQKSRHQLSMLKLIIEQKIASYKTYNDVSNQLFVRNLQVYFARSRWPDSEETAIAFRKLFTETLIAFAADLYKGAEQRAIKQGHFAIQEVDVGDFAQAFIPHEINQYEDALFFPKLKRSDQIQIESYDMDAFRDSGIHWRYLESVVNDARFIATLEPDPFAAELLVENIAQFGVLVLRVTGMIGKQEGDKRIQLEHFNAAMRLIQERVTRHAHVVSSAESNPGTAIVSSNNESESVQQTDRLFSQVSSEFGIDYMHRSSSWLNRLLRSYLKKDEGLGIITIPPAFGGSGVAAGDVNNDGFVDIFILGGLGNRLYINDQGSRFVDRTQVSGLAWTRAADGLPGEPRQPIIADFNNDGLQDILVTYVDDMHRVYKNKGQLEFEDVSGIAGLQGKGLVAGPATVFDFDNDGLLDVYISYFGDYIHGILPTLERRNMNGLENKLFRNLGDFKFAEVHNSGVNHRGWAQAVTHTDLDGDGWQDLIVGNDFGVNAYFRNLGNGKFENITESIGTGKPSYTMGIGLADLNGDLRPDIYISNIVTMNKDEKYVLPNADTPMKFNPDKLANMRVIEANDLFLSVDDSGSYSYQASQAVGRGYSSTGWSWDADFFDYDNDGDDDLYVLNGMNEFNLYSSENPYYTDPLENKKQNVYIPVSSKESNVFFVNDQGGLQNRSRNSGVDLVGNSRSASYLDIDNDGDLDIILNNYHEQANLFRNNLSQDHSNWLKIRLVGDVESKVNRDAIGARIIATRANGKQVWREVHGSIGYMSVHPKEQHIGLGKDTHVDITIIWPNGERSSHQKLAVNHRLLIHQKDNVLTRY